MTTTFSTLLPDGTRDSSSGFSFPVDKDEKVILDNPDAEASYRMCLTHPKQYADDEIVEVDRYYFIKPTMHCRCGHKIFIGNRLDGADSCPYCGQWHNQFGEELLPPEQWEED